MTYQECTEFIEELNQCKRTLVLEVLRSNKDVKGEVVMRKVVGEEYNYPEIHKAFPKYEEYLKKNGSAQGQYQLALFVKPQENNELFMERVHEIFTVCMNEEIMAMEKVGAEVTAEMKKELKQKYAELETRIEPASNAAYHIALEQRAEKIKQDISEDVSNTIHDAKMKDVIILGYSEIYNNNKEHSGGYGYVGKIYSTIM